MDGGAWWAAVHGVAKSRTRLSDFTFTFHCHALEKEMATHSSVLAWRIPGMGEPGGLLSMGSHRVGHDWSDLAAAAASQLEKSPHSNNGLSESKIGKSKKKKKKKISNCILYLLSLISLRNVLFNMPEMPKSSSHPKGSTDIFTRKWQLFVCFDVFHFCFNISLTYLLILG